LQHGILPHIHAGVIYVCQSSALMNEVSDAAVGSAGIEALHSGGALTCCSSFALDSYRCHMMVSVVMWSNEWGVKVHTPGGRTGLC